MGKRVGFKMLNSTLNISRKWQSALEVQVSWTTLSWKWPLSPNAIWALCSPLKVTNAFFPPACHVDSLFPPLVPIKLGQQLFTGEAAGSKPMRRFMQIECVRPLDESFLPARKFELVDPQWWYMWPYPNAWLQDKVITLLLVCAACPLNTCKHKVCACTQKQWASFLDPSGI